MDSDQILRPAAAATKLGVSRATLYVWVKAKRLPPPIKLGPRVSGWRQSTLDNFLAARELEAA